MAPTLLREKLPLTNKCHHYDDISEVPWDIQKCIAQHHPLSPSRKLTVDFRYWHQRYNIFQYYDYDVRLTDDAWFGVTPEPVATSVPPPLHTSAQLHSTANIIP